MTASSRLTIVSLGLALACAPAIVSAQPFYDLSGERTLAALHALRAATPSGERTVAGPSRLELARTATDLWIVSFLEPDHDDLGARVARELGIPPEEVAPTLFTELEELESRARIADVEELLTAISLVRTLALEGNGISFAGTHGLRRDALLVDAAARAIAAEDRRALATMIGDPCDGDRGLCIDPWAGWAGSSRAEIAGLLEASAASARIDEAATRGDRFAIAVAPILAEAARTIERHVIHPIPRLVEELPCSAGSSEDAPARAEVIVAIGANEIRIGRVAPVRARAGLLELEQGEDVLPSSLLFPLRTDRRDSIAALGGYLRRSLRRGAAVAIAASEEVPVERIGRVIGSIERARMRPTMLVRRAGDGSMRGVAMTVVGRRAAHRDVLVVPRASGYRVRRGEVALLEVPNEEALWYRLATIEGRRVLIDPRGDGASSELYDAAFRLGRGGASVALLRP